MFRLRNQNRKKMWLKSLLLVYMLMSLFSASYELMNKRNKYKSVEGDMLLSQNQVNWLFSKTTRRNALLSEEYHWPNGTVYYKFGSNFSSWRRNLIFAAMNKISEISCIRFMLAPENSTEYVNILKPQASICSTAVGYQRKVQPLKLSTKCMRIGVIQHELLHALGFFHQQSDPDRDKYILVNYDNIKEEKKKNFRKYSSKTVGSLSTGYDYGSVMHYGRYFFSKNGAPTIEPLQPNVEIGQRKCLSDKDILKLNLLYKCESKTKHNLTNCE